jgi:hypothetical protein
MLRPRCPRFRNRVALDICYKKKRYFISTLRKRKGGVMLCIATTYRFVSHAGELPICTWRAFMKSDDCARVGLAPLMSRAVFFALVAIDIHHRFIFSVSIRDPIIPVLIIVIAIAVDIHPVLVALALAPRGSHLGDYHCAFLYTARIDARFGQVGRQVSERAEARSARKSRLVLHLLFPLRLHLVAKRNLCRGCLTLVIRVNLPTNVFN